MFVDVNRQYYAVKMICRALDINIGGYYKWKDGKIGKRKSSDELLLKEIRKEFEGSREIYGSVRIEVELRKKGIRTSKKRVARLMRSNGLRSKMRRKFKATTNSMHDLSVAENLLNQDFNVSEPNKVWTSDITYLWTSEGWMYLAVVLDLFNRQVVGWKTSKSLGRELVSEALLQAVKSRKPAPGLIFHSDRGVQYASHAVRAVINDYKMRQSMSGKGNCYDNAVTESFFHSLKMEMVYHEKYRTRAEVELSIFKYIEIFYNRKRLHSTLNYM